MKLAGKDIHALVLEIAPKTAHVPVWEDEDQDTRRDVEALAAKIQERYIAPLQQLVLDWQAFVLDDIEDQFVDGEMPKRLAELRQRTISLAQEE